jgi:hypothetical protein
MHSIRVVPRHNEDIHFFEQARGPSSVGVHLAQKCHSTLIGGWLIAMNSSLKPHAKLRGIRRLAIRVAQKSCEDRPALLGLEVGDLVVEPIVSTRDASQEIVWSLINFCPAMIMLFQAYLPSTVSLVGPDDPLEKVSVGIVSGHRKAGEWSSTSTSWYAWEMASLSLLVGE